MPSGWFPDPHGRYEHRWFNGTAWTADVAANGQRFVDPMGAAPAGYSAQPQEPRRGNGSAAAAITLGLFAILLSWIPLLVVIGVILAILGLVFGIKGVRRSRETHSGRGLAIAGIVTSGVAFGLAIVGVVLTVSVVREVTDFIEPAANTATVTGCAIADGELIVDATLTNDDDQTNDFTVYAVILDPDGVADLMLPVDALAAGETRDLTLRHPIAAVGACDARLVVQGPLPYGLEMERVK